MPYFDPDSERDFEANELAELETDVQRSIMEHWFRRNYEDPAERTPYDSEEGGYVWIWGGPYDAGDELRNEFQGNVAEDVLEELISDLERESWKWAPTERPGDYDYVDDIAAIDNQLGQFHVAIAAIEKLLEVKVDPLASAHLLKMLYVGVVTAVETYLANAFVPRVIGSPEGIRRFVEAYADFGNIKIPLNALFKEHSTIEGRVKKELGDIVWHNLARAGALFKATLDVQFPRDSSAIYRAVAIRHDLVHRNGKTKDGVDIAVTPAMVDDLVEAAREFVEHIERELIRT
jgi:hypothetical protein